MKTSRREWLKESVALAGAAPTLWFRETHERTREEIEKRLSSDKAVHKDELPTPSLVLDLDPFESNLRKMSGHARETSINLRPHAKTHKCPDVAKRQIQGGALGVCTATIQEAEAMAEAGIRGILITSEMVGRNKTERVVRLTRRNPDTMSIVDRIAHAQELDEAARAAGITLNILIDVDPGDHRTGIAPGEDAIRLAEAIMRLPNLKLKGIHSYSGSSSHVEGFEARVEHSRKAMEKPLETLFELRKKGISTEIMSGGSTGTYNIDPALEGMTELQVGSYVFMDVDYRRIGGKGGLVYEDFAPALSVIATVISKNHPDRATLDAGLKAFATDRKFGPEIKKVTGAEYRFGGDEHGILILNNPSREIKPGDRLEFMIPHCDPNVNLYNRIYCLRADRVEAIWPIQGRSYS